MDLAVADREMHQGTPGKSEQWLGLMRAGCLRGPIVPVLVGDEDLSERMAARLLKAGFYVDAVKFPAVGLRQSRLRFTIPAACALVAYPCW